ncbi:F-box domain containing protein [Panicum miliaceum]|uniref:F-box domain containing protein n=1 Tax=Panicum miliaceum TaxID=4540 RepID=A0A3L6T720_PANMI|nr:F-box domain containing protein [Panicum miliaceum]
MASPWKKTRLSPAPPCRQDLPDEIIEDIFARMPAKSVLRCRCLSRAWAATLSSDAFVDKRLDLANRRHREVLPRLCLLPDSAAASTVYAWSPPELGEEGVFTPLMHVPHNTRNGTLAAETRPCRGVILLLSVAARRYYLCNPSVGQIAALPDGRMAGRPFPSRDYASYGLGYDARARAHKVAGVFAHGITMEDGRVGGQAIVSFSVATEEFGYVAPPPRTDVDDALRLTELAGCLGLVSSPTFLELPINKYISIWLLTGYAAGSWEKHWHIDLTKLPPAPEVGDNFLSKGVEPLALVDGGRRIVFVSDEYQVATYSLAAGTLEEVVPALYPHDVRGAARLLLLAPYEESLVPAGPLFEDALASPPAARALSVALRRLPARELERL